MINKVINSRLGGLTDPVSLTCHLVLRKRYTLPFISASYQISINLGQMVLEFY